MPFGFIRDLSEPNVYYNSKRQWYGESEKGIKQYANQFEKQNIKVMLKPQLRVSRGQFTWTNSAFSANELYHQVVSDANNQFLTGTYTLAKQFQYGSASNVVNSINPGVIPDLILNDDYIFTLFAIDGNYWVHSIIEEQFTAQ